LLREGFLVFGSIGSHDRSAIDDQDRVATPEVLLSESLVGLSDKSVVNLLKPLKG
jgi:hypothetical protein